MLGDNPIDILRRTTPVPDAFGINDGDRAFRTNPQTIRLCALNAALFGKSQRFQSILEAFPRLQCESSGTTTLIGGAHTKKNMSPRCPQSERFGLLAGPGSHYKSPSHLRPKSTRRGADGAFDPRLTGKGKDFPNVNILLTNSNHRSAVSIYAE
jgi:hypothetical protein